MWFLLGEGDYVGSKTVELRFSDAALQVILDPDSGRKNVCRSRSSGMAFSMVPPLSTSAPPDKLFLGLQISDCSRIGIVVI